MLLIWSLQCKKCYKKHRRDTGCLHLMSRYSAACSDEKYLSTLLMKRKLCIINGTVIKTINLSEQYARPMCEIIGYYHNEDRKILAHSGLYKITTLLIVSIGVSFVQHLNFKNHWITKRNKTLHFVEISKPIVIFVSLRYKIGDNSPILSLFVHPFVS